jgi:putative membrane protein
VTRAGGFSAGAGGERFGPASVVGLVVLPLLVGGVLIASLGAPTQQLNRVTAAIVNEDEPVTVDDQTIPLGRQFAAGLIAGASGGTSTAAAQNSDSSDSTDFTWILTNADEADAGLTSGRYAAVVTIPASFSAAATSIAGPAADARPATIEVATTPSSAFLDPALTQAVTTAATSALNRQLIAQYLVQVYDGFTTINEQIGQASAGASSLASGADQLSTGAAQLVGGADQLSAGLASLDAGAAELAAGLAQLDAAAQPLPGETAALAQGATGVASALSAGSTALSGATAQFAEVVTRVCALPGPGTVCGDATAALARLQTADAGVAALAGGAGQVASGADALAQAMPALVGGIDGSASGAATIASGTDASASGAASLDAGAESLASGAAQLDTGAAQLAAGLATAVEQIPVYSDDDVATLSNVVADPVRGDQTEVAAGLSSVPLFAVLALWIGGLAAALARRAVPRGELMTSAPSTSIAWRALWPMATVGAAQGGAVSIAVLVALTVTPAQGIATAAACVLIGAVFAVVNEGLAAAFGGVGRLLAVLAGVVALAAGLSSTVPAPVASVAGALPTAAARDLLLGAASGLGQNPGGAVLGLVLAALAAALLVFVGVAARRRVSPRALRARAPSAGR